eukprot:1187721-Pyramimonas_sp.AAC.1
MTGEEEEEEATQQNNAAARNPRSTRSNAICGGRSNRRSAIRWSAMLVLGHGPTGPMPRDSFYPCHSYPLSSPGPVVLLAPLALLPPPLLSLWPALIARGMSLGRAETRLRALSSLGGMRE